MTSLEIKAVFQVMDKDKGIFPKLDNIINDQEWMEFHEHFTSQF